MECPSCQKELSPLPEATHCHLCGHQLPAGEEPAALLTCSTCGQKALPAAKYCHLCGQNLLAEGEAPKALIACSSCGHQTGEGANYCPDCGEAFATFDETEFEPGKRVACSDGMCIGIIGENGKCTECGKPAGKK